MRNAHMIPPSESEGRIQRTHCTLKALEQTELQLWASLLLYKQLPTTLSNWLLASQHHWQAPFKKHMQKPQKALSFLSFQQQVHEQATADPLDHSHIHTLQPPNLLMNADISTHVCHLPHGEARSPWILRLRDQTLTHGWAINEPGCGQIPLARPTASPRRPAQPSRSPPLQHQAATQAWAPGLGSRLAIHCARDGLALLQQARPRPRRARQAATLFPCREGGGRCAASPPNTMPMALRP